MQQIPALQFLSKEERRSLLQKSHGKAAMEIALTWMWIAAVFTLGYFLPNVITVVIA